MEDDPGDIRRRARAGQSRPGGEQAQRGGMRNLAQLYCLLAGVALLLGGIFGFFADATFDTAYGSADTDRGGNANNQLQGDGFLGFEVNGWHNVVHLASGAVLLLAARRAGPARAVAIALGLVYGVVTVLGLLNGNDVLGILPVNPADNILHLVLSLLGLGAGLLSGRGGRSREPRGRQSAPRARQSERRRDGHTTPVPTRSGGNVTGGELPPSATQSVAGPLDEQYDERTGTTRRRPRPDHR